MNLELKITQEKQFTEFTEPNRPLIPVPLVNKWGRYS